MCYIYFPIGTGPSQFMLILQNEMFFGCVTNVKWAICNYQGFFVCPFCFCCSATVNENERKAYPHIAN